MNIKSLLVAGLLSLSGCATVGRQIDMDKVNTIKEGVTTESTVSTMLGSPDAITRRSDGTSDWQYTFARASTKATSFIPVVGLFAGGYNTQSQVVIVTLKDGIVRKVVSTQSGMNIDTGATASSRASQPELNDNKRSK